MSEARNDDSEGFIKLSQEAIVYANKIASESFTKNMINQSNLTVQTNFAFTTLAHKFNEMAKIRKKLLTATTPVEWDESPPRRDDKNYVVWANAWYQASIEASKKIGVGNCEALAFLALEFLSKKLPKNVPIEVVRCVNDQYTNIKKDHVFLVIGRDQSKDVNNIREWGTTAIICDPWMKKSYPATVANMRNNLEYITDLYQSHEESYVSALQKFNPETDKLRTLIDNSMIYQEPEIHAALELEELELEEPILEEEIVEELKSLELDPEEEKSKEDMKEVKTNAEIAPPKIPISDFELDEDEIYGPSEASASLPPQAVVLLSKSPKSSQSLRDDMRPKPTPSPKADSR